MSVRSRVTDLASRFEVAPPPQPPRERVQSAVDAPRAEVGREGRAASIRSAAKADAAASGTAAHARRRRTPAILAGDDDRMRQLKRAAQAKEDEIQALAARIAALCERLSRVTVQLDAAASAPVVAAAGAAHSGRVRSAEFQHGATEARRTVAAARAPKLPTSSAPAGTSLDAILAAARSPRSAPPPGAGARPPVNPPAASASNNSLEAILAAARGGGSGSGGAKYSKMMRNLK